VFRGEGAAGPIAGKKLPIALAHVGPLPRQNRLQGSIQDDAVDAGFRAAYAGVSGMLVMGDQAGLALLRHDEFVIFVTNYLTSFVAELTPVATEDIHDVYANQYHRGPT
jgi:hypothetical protein